MLVARSLNLTAKDIQIRPGEAMQIGNFKVSADPQMQMYTYFYKDRDGRPAIQEDRSSTLRAQDPGGEIRDKIVLIGPTAAGSAACSSRRSTRRRPRSSFSDTRSRRFCRGTSSWCRPGMDRREIGLLLVAAYLIALLPRLSAGLGAGVSAGIVVALLATHFVLMTGQGVWLELMLPVTLLIVGHVLLVTKRFMMTERRQGSVRRPGAANARMLAWPSRGRVSSTWPSITSARCAR